MIDVNISDVFISFFSDDEKINKYITREFKNQITHDIENFSKQSDMKINIYTKEKYKFVQNKVLNKDIFIDNSQRVVQIIRAKNRKTFVVYSKNFKEVRVYIPYNTKDSVSKIANPKYLNKWQNCLLDFFQGPFIGIMEYHLLSKKHTFMHGCSFAYMNLGYVFCGKAQIGKTEIVKAIKNSAEIISEDFTILYDKSYICSYQKSIGVFKENINIDEYLKNVSKKEKFLQKLNFGFFKVIHRYKSKRILFFDELFPNSYSKNKVFIGNIFYIERDNGTYRVEKMSSFEFIKNMLSILENEFNNLPNFWTILNLCTNISKTDFMSNVQKCLEYILKDIGLFSINIPFYKEKSDFKIKINDMLKDILEKVK